MCTTPTTQRNTTVLKRVDPLNAEICCSLSSAHLEYVSICAPGIRFGRMHARDNMRVWLLDGAVGGGVMRRLDGGRGVKRGWGRKGSLCTHHLMVRAK